MSETVVIFRRDRMGDCFALFPELPGDDRGVLCTAYAHIGQHCAADYGRCIADSDPAAPAEYADLFEELEKRGYDLSARHARHARASSPDRRRAEIEETSPEDPGVNDPTETDRLDRFSCIWRVPEERHGHAGHRQGQERGQAVKVRFFDIEWDLEKGERAQLPSECVLEVEDDLDLEEEGADALSDRYGFCVSRCSFEVIG